jgi:hypothetical protein
MKATVLYRIASILLLLFAAGHTVGFRQIDPKWGIDSLISSMQSQTTLPVHPYKTAKMRPSGISERTLR